MPSTSVTTKRMIWSATRKNIEAIATMTNTMAVVIAVSRRVGQVTFCGLGAHLLQELERTYRHVLGYHHNCAWRHEPPARSQR